MDDLFENLDRIKKDCSEFLRTTEYPLLRGLNRSGTFNIVNIRSNRVYSSGRVTQDAEFRNFLYNEMVYEEYGVSDLRRRVAFFTGDINEAKRYGEPYVVFPVNGTKFMVSPIADSVYLLAILFEEFQLQFNNELEAVTAEGPQEVTSSVTQFYRKSDTDIFKADIDWYDYRQRVQLLGEDGEEAFQDALEGLSKTSTWRKVKPFEVSMRGLNRAITEGYEIMAFDADYYYAVNYEEMLFGMDTYYDNETEAYEGLLEMIEEGF